LIFDMPLYLCRFVIFTLSHFWWIWFPILLQMGFFPRPYIDPDIILVE
jgi:hypothetical protein